MKVPNISTTSINLLYFFRKRIKATIGSNPIDLEAFLGQYFNKQHGPEQQRNEGRWK